MWALRSPFDGREQNPVGTGKRIVQTCVLFWFLFKKINYKANSNINNKNKTKQIGINI